MLYKKMNSVTGIVLAGTIACFTALSCATPPLVPSEWKEGKAEWGESAPVKSNKGTRIVDQRSSSEWSARGNTGSAQDNADEWGIQGKRRTVPSDTMAGGGASSHPLSDVDVNIPQSRIENRNAIAVVIGNTNYQKTKRVDYSINDAQAVRKYLINVFGYKEDNIFLLLNASKTELEIIFGNDKNYKGKLFNAVKEGMSDVFVYYSGHGAPGLKDKKGYFVPVEADPQYLELSGYPAEAFYENLSKLPARSITVVLDACFSGASIFDNISPIVLEIDNPVIKLKKGVVMSSSSGSQVSTWYNDKQHGMFTYFFLKAIQEKISASPTRGKLTFEELYRYVADKTEGVPYYARRLHGIEQNPTLEGNFKGKVLVSY